MELVPEAERRILAASGRRHSQRLAMLDPARLNRIRWRCRRGMLENDLVLARYLDARGDSLSESEVGLLDRLLDLPDNELWDLIAGRADPRDPAVAVVLQQLRAA